ncbi:MAG: hypothetical protein WBW81_02190 [Methylocella sp.]
MKARYKRIIQIVGAKQLCLYPQKFLVNELRAITAPVDEDMVFGIFDFQMSSGGHPGTIMFIHHEAANASIVEALFPQQGTHHKGVYDDMMFWTEMDNDLRGGRRIVGHDPTDDLRTRVLVDTK